MNHIAAGVAAFGPFSIIDRVAMLPDLEPAVWLNFAEKAAKDVLDPLTEAAKVSGDHTLLGGAIGQLATDLNACVVLARLALLRKDVHATAKYFANVALCWTRLWQLSEEVQAVKLDAQRLSTESGAAAAEKHLRALAAAGEVVVGRAWRAAALEQFRPITARAALTVWTAVAKDFPRLSSSAGKPKARRQKA